MSVAAAYTLSRFSLGWPDDAGRTFSPFVRVTSHPDDVPTSPIDQPARCRRSWQASMSAGPDMAAMVIHARGRDQGSHGRQDGSRI
jgi:hypothetical protein